MTTKSIIVAIDANNAIGKENELLCHLPADLKYFKSVTEGHTIIMGRKTFESLPKGALPNRRNVVITRNEGLCFPNCEMCSSVGDALCVCEGEDEVFFIGGGSVYKEAIGIADKLYITRIGYAFEGVDTFFPPVDEGEWMETWREEHKADEKNKYDYSFLQYEKIKR